MKSLWILFNLAWKLAMIVLSFSLIVAIGMGIYLIFFEFGDGPYLIVISILIIVGMVASRSKRGAESEQSD